MTAQRGQSSAATIPNDDEAELHLSLLSETNRDKEEASKYTPPSTPVAKDERLFEEIISDIGAWGRWQKMTAVMNGLMSVIAGINTLVYPMLTGKFDVTCEVPHSNLSSWNSSQIKTFTSPDHCSYYDLDYRSIFTSDLDYSDAVAQYHQGNFSQNLKACGKWSYQSYYFHNTVINEFGLVCDRLWLESSVHSSFTVGCMIGVFCFGWLSDRFGRKRTICVFTPLMIILNFVLSASPNVTVFLILRTFQGVVNFGIFTVIYIISMETTSPSKRAYIGNLVHIPWGFQFLSVSLFGWLVPNWRVLQAIISIPSLFCLLYFTPLLPESPRWLVLNGKYKEASKILARAARWNKSTIDTDKLPARLEHIHDVHVKWKENNAQAASVNVVHLFKTPEMRFRTILQMFVWFQGALTNHGINFLGPKLAENPFVAFSCIGIGEILAPTAGAWLFSKGRRIPITMTYFVGAIACFIMLPLLRGVSPNGLIALTVLGTFLSDMAFNGIYVYASELFPTQVRNLGLGTCSAAARVGSSISSFIVTSGDLVWWLPASIFGGFMALGGGINFLLPSTDGVELPETVSDVEEMGKSRTSLVSVNGVNWLGSKDTSVTANGNDVEMKNV